MRVAAHCRRLVESAWFDPLMLVIILLNAIALGLETYDHQPCEEDPCSSTSGSR